MRRRATLPVVMVTIAAAALSETPPLLLTVRQADRLATAFDLVAGSISSDGRYVAFVSYARLVASDTNDRSDIYVFDRSNGTVTIETLSADGRASNHDSAWPRISGDGRFLVYETTQDSDGRAPIRVVRLRDRSTGKTQALGRGDDAPNGPSRSPAISSNGRIVVFASCATNLVDGPDANGFAEDIYAYDTETHAIRRVSVDAAGRQPPDGSSFAPTISADGREVAFTSTADFDTATQAPPVSSARAPNVYVRDTQLGVTMRIGLGRGGALPNGRSYDPAISGNGRYVAFVSDASNLTARDENDFPDVFLQDLAARTTTLVSRSVSGGSANGPSAHPAISADGNIVVFQSEASDLICGSRCPAASRDINLVSDVFLSDRQAKTMLCVSSGRQRWMEPSAGAAIDGLGDVVAFSSRHPVAANDVAYDFDLFVRVEVSPRVSRHDTRAGPDTTSRTSKASSRQ